MTGPRTSGTKISAVVAGSVVLLLAALGNAQASAQVAPGAYARPTVENGLRAAAAAARSAGKSSPLAQLSKQMRNRARSSRIETFALPLGFAPVGTTAYRALAEVSENTRTGAESLRAVLVADDLVTGLSRTIVSRRSTYILGLAAGSGHLYGLMYRVDSEKRDKYRMQLVEFMGETGAPREIYTEPIDGRYRDCLPGRLAGVTAAGEPILVRPYLGTECGFEWIFGYPVEDNAHLVTFAADNSQRELAAYVNINTPVITRGDRLLFTRGTRARVRDLATGAETEYWTGDFNTVDMSGAGDVLVSWMVGDKSEGDEPDALARDVSGKTAPADDRFAEGSGLLALPAASPESPAQQALDSASELSLGVYCGAGIARLVSSTKYLEDSFGSSLLSTLILGSEGTLHTSLGGPIGIELRGLDGAFIRTLGVLKASIVYPPRCVDGTLVVPYAPRSKKSSEDDLGKRKYGVFDAR